MSGNGQRDGSLGLKLLVQAIASDIRSRTLATTALATGWDLVYAAYLAVAGHFLSSLRMRMTSYYYFSLVGVSACLLIGLLAAVHARDDRISRRRELTTALVSSILLLAVTAVVALVIKQTDNGWQAADYATASFYMLAGYAIVMLSITIRGWRRYRRDSSPAIALSKGLSLCKAIMTFYFLALAATQRYADSEGLLLTMLGGAKKYAGMAAAGLSFSISVVLFTRSVRGLWSQTEEHTEPANKE